VLSRGCRVLRRLADSWQRCHGDAATTARSAAYEPPSDALVLRPGDRGVIEQSNGGI